MIQKTTCETGKHDQARKRSEDDLIQIEKLTCPFGIFYEFGIGKEKD